MSGGLICELGAHSTNIQHLICDFQSSLLFSTSAAFPKNCGPKPAVRLRQKVTDCSIRCRPVAQLTSNIRFTNIRFTNIHSDSTSSNLDGKNGCAFALNHR